MLKQTWKRRYNVIYNDEFFLILKYERRSSWERFVENWKLNKNLFQQVLFIILLIDGFIIIDDQHLLIFKVS